MDGTFEMEGERGRVRARYAQNGVAIDMEPMRRLAGRADAPGAEKFLSNLGGSEAPLPIDMWIRPDGRPLRYEVNLRLPRPGGGRQQSAMISLTVDRYDVSVDTEPPPAGQVTDDSVLK
jgi:hypothetical protein